MAEIVQLLLHNDLFIAIGLYAVLALPDVAKLYLPFVYPASTLERIQQNANAKLANGSVSTPVPSALTKSATLHQDCTSTMTDISTHTLTSTATSTSISTRTVTDTVFDTITDKVTETSVSTWRKYITQYSAYTAGPATPHTTFTDWCDQVDGPCAVRHPLSENIDKTSTPELWFGWKDFFLVFFIMTIAILAVANRTRTGMPWARKIRAENRGLKQQLQSADVEKCQIEHELRNSNSAKKALKKQVEDRQRLLSRANLALERLAAFKIGTLEEGDQAFDQRLEDRSSEMAAKAQADEKHKAGLESANKAHQDEITELQEKIAELQEQLKFTEVEQKRLLLKNYEPGVNRSFQELLNDKDGEIHRLRKELKSGEKEQPIQDLQRTVDDLNSKLNDLKDCPAQKQALETELRKAQTTINALRKDVSDQKKVKEEQASSEKNNCEAEKKLLRDEIAALKKAKEEPASSRQNSGEQAAPNQDNVSQAAPNQNDGQAAADANRNTGDGNWNDLYDM